METIDLQITKGGQRAYFVEILKHKVTSTIFRVTIESDSYDAQCSAHIDRWDGTSWQRVHYIVCYEMATPTSLAYNREPLTGTEFAEDREHLLAVAREVCGLKTP